MSDVVNLRQARKLRERARKTRQAAANRASFGRSRAERASQDAEAARLERGLEGARRDEAGRDGSGPAPPEPGPESGQESGEPA